MNLEQYPSRIIGIQFGNTSTNDTVGGSVCNITVKDTLVQGKPAINGLMSPYMGPISDLANGNSMICPTDGHGEEKSPYYFGHIKLAQPTLWLNHINEIKRIMECICLNCGANRLDPSTNAHVMDVPIERRPQMIKKILKSKDTNKKTCRIATCTYHHPANIKHHNMANIIAEYKYKTNTSCVTYSPEMIKTLFKRVSDQTMLFIGCNPTFSRIENYICDAIPVPPYSMRPSTKAGDAQRKSEDDTTVLFQRLIQENNDVKDKFEELEKGTKVVQNPNDREVEFMRTINAKQSAIQYLHAAIIENKFRGTETPMQHQSGKAFTSIKMRIDGKMGRVRRNLSAKRVDVSARSVISGDPNIGIRNIGVPLKIANGLTKPARVTEYNQSSLQQLVSNHFAEPKMYPSIEGIQYLQKDDTYSDKSVITKDTVLDLQTIVYRTLKTGDMTIANRAPSLHKASAQGHCIQVMPEGSTLRMPINVTPGYNADFDGDEMNMHVPQHIIAETELMGRASVVNNIINPATNAPLAGTVQDTMTGISVFTMKDRKLEPLQAMRILGKTSRSKYSAFYEICYDDGDENPNKKTKLIDTKDVMTCIIPKEITMKRDTGFLKNAPAGSDTSNLVLEIKNGNYIRGQLDKASIMDGTTGLLHTVITECGNEVGADLLDDFESIANQFLKTHAYSVGIADMMHTEKTKIAFRAEIEKGMEAARALIQELHTGNFKNKTAYTNKQYFEIQMMKILLDCTEKAGSIGYKAQRGEKTITGTSKINGMNGMVEFGSKGKMTQLQEMSVTLGQQKLDGGRVQDDLDGRTLPHYLKYDLMPGPRGFVVNCFQSGLTPTESNAHNKVARSGLTNSAVKTQETGYMQRRCVKFMENIMALYDNTQRNGQKIIQLRFGDDGSDPTKHLNVEIGSFLTTSVEDMYKRYDFNDLAFNRDTKKRRASELGLEKSYILKYVSFLLEAQADLVTRVFANAVVNTVQCTVNFPELIITFGTKYGLNEESVPYLNKNKRFRSGGKVSEVDKITERNVLTDLTPVEAMERIESVYETKLNSLSEFNRPTEMFRMLFFYYLTPKTLMGTWHFSKLHLDLLLEEVVMRYLEGLLDPGTNTGVITGQTLGSSATQDTLNVFHSAAGLAAKSSRLIEGIPRSNEILRASSTKTSYVKAPLIRKPKPADVNLPQDDYDKKMAQMVSQRMERVVLNDVINRDSIIHSYGDSTDVDSEDGRLIKRFRRHENLEREFMNLAPIEPNPDDIWIFRLDLNPTLMAEKKVTMEDIDYCLRQTTFVQGKRTDEVHTNIQSVYSDMNDEKLVIRIPIPHGNVSAKALRDTEEMLLNIVIRGVENIKDVTVEYEKNSLVWNPELGCFKNEKNVPYLDATGNNLRGVLGIEGVDTYRTYTNDIRVMKEVFGMESARYMIISELSKTLSGANYAHISLLADKMTNGVDISPVWRTGIRDDDVGPLMKGSFETTSEVFNESSRRGSLDNMCGLSANVICGQLGKFGTNSFQVIISPDYMAELEDIPLPVEEEEEMEVDEEQDDVDEAKMKVIKSTYVPPTKSMEALFVPFMLPLLF